MDDIKPSDNSKDTEATGSDSTAAEKGEMTPTSETSPVVEPKEELLATPAEAQPKMESKLPEAAKAPGNGSGSGVKPSLVIFFVVLALVLGGLIAYVVADKNMSNDSNEALQAQIDDLNQQLTDAQAAAQDKNTSEKDQQISDLTEENEGLKTDNQTLSDTNTQLEADNQALSDACNAATDCVLPN